MESMRSIDQRSEPAAAGSDGTQENTSGCRVWAVFGLSLLWLWIVPPGAMLLASRLLGGLLPEGGVAAVATLVTAGLLLMPFVGTVLIARRRTGWQSVGIVAAGFAAVAGFLVLDGAVRAVSPAGSDPGLFGEGAWTAVFRLVVLLPYVLLVAWQWPRLAGVDRSGWVAWLGLDRFDLPLVLLALALSAVLTMPWPVSGALGDPLTGLSYVLQILVWQALQVLFFWGVLFSSLRPAFPSGRAVPFVLVLIHTVFVSAGVLPHEDWTSLWGSVSVLPLALLLAELRVRRRGIWSLLILAFFYRVVPSLFIDPRDVLVQQGIPELQHLLSYVIVWVVALLVATLLWSGRRGLPALLGDRPVPDWVRLASAGLAALVLWGVWGGVYLFAGSPGFVPDGFIILLEEQADLSAAYDIADRQARLAHVRQTLIETADRSQADLRVELDRLGLPYRPYYLINMIRVDGHRWRMGRFAGRPGVAQVILNPNTRIYPRTIPIPSESGGPGSGVQANLEAIGADEAWALGATGEGIVVGGQDSGYDWTHPALKPHYRGWDGQQAAHDYNWHDAWDGSPTPFDDHGHGTHTMGTVLGDDGADNHTGVAPGARWIGCRNMRRGYGNPASYTECMEFFLAPFPHGGDPFTDGDVGQAPHLVTNSWGCPYWEGCDAGILEPAVDGLRAAGIMMVVGAGNEGPACRTAGVAPANYDSAFTVGATNNRGNVVFFSSRGPVDGLVKPDISAPGEGVRSTGLEGQYFFASGTSMATPHVAGVVALVWSANPDLAGDIPATEALLCQTAVPRPVEEPCTVGGGYLEPVCACGGLVGTPNNVYGCGFVDAQAAVQAALEE